MQEKSSKILILATSYLPLIGGAELAIKHLTDNLPEFYFDLVTARSYSNLSENERIGNVNVFRAGRASAMLDFLLPKNFLPLAIFFEARKLLISNKYDLVYVLQASQAGGAMWLLKLFGYIKQPIVLNIQEGKDLSKQSFLTKIFRSLIINSADYYSPISNFLKDFLISKGVHGDRIFIIPNGVDTSILKIESNNESIQNLKNALGIKSERVIITISRLVEKNGVADLIKSIVYVKDNYSEPVKLLVIGNGNLEHDLKSLSRISGLEKEVLFLGEIKNEELSKYLSIADVFVRPSYSEGLGISFLEAMALGVPIIGTKVGGIPDFLKDGETGLFCEVGDSQDIGRKIIGILSDKELHDRLASQGQDFVREFYDWKIIAQKFRNFYEIATG